MQFKAAWIFKGWRPCCCAGHPMRDWPGVDADCGRWLAPHVAAVAAAQGHHEAQGGLRGDLVGRTGPSHRGLTSQESVSFSGSCLSHDCFSPEFCIIVCCIVAVTGPHGQDSYLVRWVACPCIELSLFPCTPESVTGPIIHNFLTLLRISCLFCLPFSPGGNKENRTARNTLSFWCVFEAASVPILYACTLSYACIVAQV